MSKKVLITGAKGQLGTSICNSLSNYDFEVIAIDKDNFDLTNRQVTIEYINKVKPDVVIHCAAYVLVDKAEEDRDLCYDVNVNATKNIVDACLMVDTKLIYFSTDYVLSAEGEDEIFEDHETNALNHYGETKRLGEEYIIKNMTKYFIFRISWIYGIYGNNFIKTMLKLAETKDEISVVYDQVGSPTFTNDIADMMHKFIDSDKYGIYNMTNEGFCSWYDFAVRIFELSNISMKVNKISSDDYVTLAKRPKNSRLSKKKLLDNGFGLLPTWDDALQRYMKELLNN